MAQVSVTNIIRTKLGEIRNQILRDIANEAINRSPVDTGAYVESFQITTVSGGGRGYTSHGRPRQQDEELYKNIAKAQIASDVEAIPEGAEYAYFTNRAPHAKYVEGKHAVMASARDAVRAYGRTPPRRT